MKFIELEHIIIEGNFTMKLIPMSYRRSEK